MEALERAQSRFMRADVTRRTVLAGIGAGIMSALLVACEQ